MPNFWLYCSSTSIKEYGVTNSIGNQRIAVGPLEGLDLRPVQAAPAFLQALEQSSSIEGCDSLLKLTLRKPNNTFD